MDDSPDLPASLDHVGIPVNLTAYENARQALTAAVDVDEVKGILDISIAMAVYAKQAKDEDLIAKATEIRKRAERRLGEMIEAQKKTVGLAKAWSAEENRVVEDPISKTPTLEEAGIDKHLADRARKAAKMPEDKFEAEIQKASTMAVAAAGGNREIIRQARAEQNRIKKERRAAREQALAGKILALPEKKYGVVLEDYEWDQKTWSDKGKDRHASNHYPTSTDAHTAEEIVERTKERFICAADDCALFKWATTPHLAIAIDVLRLQGFDYVSHCIWRKIRRGKGRGTGYWFTGEHEILLVGTRGNIPAPPTALCGSVIDAPVGRHSEKPEIFAELIERAFPNVPKIELNARAARPGWDSWGLEAPGLGAPSQTPTPDDDFPDIPPSLRRTV